MILGAYATTILEIFSSDQITSLTRPHRSPFSNLFDSNIRFCLDLAECLSFLDVMTVILAILLTIRWAVFPELFHSMFLFLFLPILRILVVLPECSRPGFGRASKFSPISYCLRTPWAVLHGTSRNFQVLYGRFRSKYFFDEVSNSLIWSWSHILVKKSRRAIKCWRTTINIIYFRNSMKQPFGGLPAEPQVLKLFAFMLMCHLA